MPTKSISQQPQQQHAVRLLVITDEGDDGSSLVSVLEDHGFTVDQVAQPREGVRLGCESQYGAILIDGGIGSIPQIKAVIHDLRQCDVDDPVMVLGVSGTDPVVALLDGGADECIQTPIELAEVLARLGALLRRCTPGEKMVLTFEDLSLDLTTRRIERAGQPIRLTARELALLEFFMRHRGQALSRDQISQAVWGRDFDPNSNVIDVFLSKLRQKIDKPYDTPYLHTLVGSGYMLSATEPGT